MGDAVLDSTTFRHSDIEPQDGAILTAASSSLSGHLRISPEVAMEGSGDTGGGHHVDETGEIRVQSHHIGGVGHMPHITTSSGFHSTEPHAGHLKQRTVPSSSKLSSIGRLKQHHHSGNHYSTLLGSKPNTPMGEWMGSGPVASPSMSTAPTVHPYAFGHSVPSMYTSPSVQYHNQQSWFSTSGTAYVGGGTNSRPLLSTMPTLEMRERSTNLPVLGDGGARLLSRTIIGEERTEGNRHVVKGDERVVGQRSFVDESRVTVLNERIVEHDYVIPRKIIVEDIIEKVIIIPERRIREEYSEEMGKRIEKIIEVSKPIINEKMVELPEIEYVEQIIEVTELIVQERVKEVPRIEVQERIIEVPKIIQQEKLVEVPEIQYREVPVERIEEVPEIREQIVIKEIPIPQYVDRPYPEYVTVEEMKDVDRVLPIPIEATYHFEFKLPQIRPHWKKVDVPLYVPRFVEIPVPIEMMHEKSVEEAERYAQQISMLGYQSAASLCELENLAKVKHIDFQAMLKTDDMTNSVIRALQNGRLQVTGTFSSKTGGDLVLNGVGGYNVALSGAVHQTSRPFLQSDGGMVTTSSYHTKIGKYSTGHEVMSTTFPSTRDLPTHSTTFPAARELPTHSGARLKTKKTRSGRK